MRGKLDDICEAVAAIRLSRAAIMERAAVPIPVMKVTRLGAMEGLCAAFVRLVAQAEELIDQMDDAVGDG